MQYEDLLAKYILHVRQCEGIDFLDRLNDGMGSDVVFAEEEVKELRLIAIGQATITSWEPTPNLRWYSLDERYFPPKLQRQFNATTSDGLSGQLWVEVDRNDTFRRIETGA